MFTLKVTRRSRGGIVSVGRFFQVKRETIYSGFGGFAFEVESASHIHRAASLEHALELGVIASARWLAVSLLAASSDARELGSNEVGIERLRLMPDAARWFMKVHPVKTPLLPGSVCPLESWSSTPGWVVQVPDDWSILLRRSFATEEQATAYALELGAPWIAEALARAAEGA